MASRKVHLFNVAPAIPPDLAFLETLSRNLWWCWNLDAIELFRRIGPQLWRESGHNPLVFLSAIPQKRLEALTGDDAFLSHMSQVQSRFESEVLNAKPSWIGGDPAKCLAYFSLEYGVHESMSIYSGGLGVLAGDLLKAASDKGMPLVAVGLLYRQGYFQQYLNKDGWQQESYPENEIQRMPLVRAGDVNGGSIMVRLPLPAGQTLNAAVWRADVGRVKLYLLDANISENVPELRKTTNHLYGGDRLVRLRQELLLGIGGFRALLAAGHDPVVCHMNEGHAAFLSTARVAHLRERYGLDVNAAAEVAERTNVFTTHTPVPAGNEWFATDVLRPHLEALKELTGMAPENVIAMGQAPGSQNRNEVLMTVLGLRMSRFSNGVSELHGRVARRMWAHLWPSKAEDELPIGHVTNGVHVPSWLSPDITVLYDRYLGSQWRDDPGNEHLREGILQIPDEELWRAHELSKSRLVRVAREHMESQYAARSASRAEVVQARGVLDHGALTIGFARRFATYKRATLLLRDPARFEALLSNESAPVQIIFAGKAHPADETGKDLIRQLVLFCRKANVRHRMIFLENYDINVARSMVQGVDVWMNTPRRPLEASGTSGMKAAMNGVPNLSVLDGWWSEGYTEGAGWAIGDGSEYEDHEYQDTVESQALYNLLENDIIPLFYNRPAGDVPTGWTQVMKNSIKLALGYFTSHRMMCDYDSICYQPALKEYDALTADGCARAKALVAQRERLNAEWKNVRISMPEADRDISALHVGDKFGVVARVHLGGLRPDEVDVHVYYGPVNNENEILESHVESMKMSSSESDSTFIYRQDLACSITGRYGFTARVLPRGSDWKNVMPGFVTWADGSV